MENLKYNNSNSNMYNFALILQQFINYLNEKYLIKSVLRASIPVGSTLRHSHILVDFVDFVYADFQNRGKITKIRLSLEIVVLDTLGLKHLNNFMNMIYDVKSKMYLENEFLIKDNVYGSILNIQKEDKSNIYYIDIELNNDFEALTE